MTVVSVFVAALATALATGLGAVPFAFGRGDVHRWLGRANAGASGFMLGAGVGLLVEGVQRSLFRTAAGAVAGALFVLVASRRIGEHENARLGTLAGADARKAL